MLWAFFFFKPNLSFVSSLRSFVLKICQVVIRWITSPSSTKTSQCFIQPKPQISLFLTCPSPLSSLLWECKKCFCSPRSVFSPFQYIAKHKHQWFTQLCFFFLLFFLGKPMHSRANLLQSQSKGAQRGPLSTTSSLPTPQLPAPARTSALHPTSTCHKQCSGSEACFWGSAHSWSSRGINRKGSVFSGTG